MSGRVAKVTVAELIELLQRMPPDALTDTEGCDCTGPCGGVKLCKDGIVLLTRNDKFTYDENDDEL